MEKMLKASFIYLTALTEWVSNHVPIDKKKGMIDVCTEFCDFNKAHPKDNYPTPFIDQIIDACVGSEVFFLWMVSLSIIKFKLNRKTNIKWISFFLGVHFRIRKSPLD